MNRQEIKEYLPHREPMLFVDEMDVNDGVATASYSIRGDEFFLQGHFPDRPVVPGVILCEIMGQGSVLLVQEHLNGRTPLYAGFDNVRFKRAVHPGDTVTVRSVLVGSRGMFFTVDSSASVGGAEVCRGRFSFMLVDNNTI